MPVPSSLNPPSLMQMGLFDGIQKALNNALANDESLGAPPPDGLSQVI